jgi:hypothetical protein
MSDRVGSSDVFTAGFLGSSLADAFVGAVLGFPLAAVALLVPEDFADADFETTLEAEDDLELGTFAGMKNW